MEWNIQAIRRESWNTTFRKGWRAWFMLVVVCFIFAFIGASNASQATFVDSADQLIGAQDDLLPGNIDYLKAYIVETPLVKYVPFITSELALAVIDSLSKSVTWVVRLLAGLLAFGFGGLFGVYAAAPAIHAFAGRYSRRTQVIAASLLCAAFIADIICCLIFGFNSGAGVGGAL